MANKFLSLDEAAKLLGVSSEELTDMRLRQQIYGYRDGGSWKFKAEDVERAKEERANRPAASKSAATDDDDLLPVDLDSSSGDSGLLTEFELGPASSGGSSTVIGQADKPVAAGGSDLTLGGGDLGLGSGVGSDLKLGGSDLTLGGSDLTLGGSDLKLGGSDLKLGGSDLKMGGSDLKLGGSDLKPGGSDLTLASDLSLGSDLALGSDPKPSSDLKLGSDVGSGLALGSDAGSGLNLGADPAAGSGLGLGSDIILVSADDRGPSSDVILAPPDDDVLGSPSELPLDMSDSATVVKSGSELQLGGSALIGGPGMTDLSGAPSGGSSLLGGDSLLLAPDDGQAAGGDSSLHLADDDVLGGAGSTAGSGMGSDITHRPSDSGILLIDPSDSGLSLDKPIDLSNSDMLKTTDFSASESAELKADDDFLLTPLEENAEDESDSGSQVIMLDTEGEFDDATATLLASQVPGLNSSMLVEEESPLGGLGGGLGALGGDVATARGSAMGGAGPMMVPAGPEVQFSIFSVAGLAVCSVALVICGIMMYDVVRNMWSWDSPYGVDSVILRTLIK
jgi:excisionase family DNA binding protein